MARKHARSGLCRFLPASAMLLGVALLPPVGLLPVRAQDPWKVHDKVFGEPKDPQPDTMKKAKDVSGIACATISGFPRVCLMADDESQGAQVIIVRDGDLQAGPFIRLVYDVYGDKLLELDAEGVAYADGAFYVTGSHGRPRHESDSEKEAKNHAKAAATRRIFRIRIPDGAVDPRTGNLTGSPEIRPSIELARLIEGQSELTAAFDRELESNGLTIEG